MSIIGDDAYRVYQIREYLFMIIMQKFRFYF